MPLVLGVDSSTQSTKVEARSIDSGEVVAVGTAAHPTVQPPTSEQDPGSWWDALVAAVAQLGDIRSDVVAISVAGQQHGLVLLGGDGASLRPAKLWNDTTSAPQADRLVADMGASSWADRCGSVPVASFTVTKLAWVAEHEPQLLDQIVSIQLPHDHLTWRLTGEHVTDRGDASGSGWFDPARGAYRSELLDAAGAGLDLSVLPQVLDPTEVAGTLQVGAAEELGLPPGIVVGPGTGDNMAGALGLGLRPGDSVMSLGTSGTAYAVSSTPTNDASGFVAGFADASGGYLPLVCTLNATKVTDTFARMLGAGRYTFAALAMDGDPRADGPILVPYLDGERTPNLPDARGVMVGLTNDVTPSQVALAAHDGVLCGLLDGLDALTDNGVELDARRFLVGGGSRSSAYRQRYADLADAPVLVPDVDEAVAAGAALQAAAVASGGAMSDLAEAWGLGAGSIVEPRPDVQGAATRARYAAARDQVIAGLG